MRTRIIIMTAVVLLLYTGVEAGQTNLCEGTTMSSAGAKCWADGFVGEKLIVTPTLPNWLWKLLCV